MARKCEYGYHDLMTQGALDRYLRKSGAGVLIPCAKIDNPDLTVGILGFNSLNPERFSLSPKDKQPIHLTITNSGQAHVLRYPGKSAFLCVPNSKERDPLCTIVEQHMDRPINRNDHLHQTTVGLIEKAGWQTIWAPLPSRNSWSHVRLVAFSVLNGSNKPSEQEMQALCNVLIKIVK